MITRDERREERTTLAPFALVPVLVAAGIGTAVLLLTAGRYGYHRDELYFLACARHMAWGFVDQPPITPAIAKLSQAVAPDSLVALRVIPALIYASLVVLAGLTARELGAGRTGQLGASLCAATAPGLLLAGHLLSTTTPDLLVWALVSFLLIRLLRTEDERLWLAIGLTIGVGLENKWSIGFLVIGLLIGLLVTPQRRFLKTPVVRGRRAPGARPVGSEPLVAVAARLAADRVVPEPGEQLPRSRCRRSRGSPTSSSSRDRSPLPSGWPGSSGCSSNPRLARTVRSRSRTWCSPWCSRSPPGTSSTTSPVCTCRCGEPADDPSKAGSPGTGPDPLERSP